MNPRDFSHMTSPVMRKKISELKRSGVVFLDDKNIYIEPSVKIDEGTQIFPNVLILGKTTIGKNCKVESGVHLESSTVYDRTIIRQGSMIKYARIGAECVIGPYAILEGKEFSDKELSLGLQSVKISNSCIIGAQAHLHDWVVVNPEAEVAHCEIVRSFIGSRTKIKHASYIGDATIDHDCNIGAGTIFGNYDGINKHRVVVEAGVFIGIHTSIISAKTGKIGKEAFIAANTLVMEEVKPGTVVVRKVNKLEIIGKSRHTEDGWETSKL